MFCPNCKTEYLDTDSRCRICGAELVSEEDRSGPLNEKERNDSLVVAWRGGDPNAVSEVEAILREAGIQHNVQATNDHMVFELGMPRPKYAFRVFSSDLARAQELLAGVRESAPFGLEAGMGAAETPAGPERVPNVWKPAAAVVDIWSGEDEGFATLLEACLAENQIGVRRQVGQRGALHLMVMPADEAAAREILRQIVEGTPPA
ncbi:MAG: hypothetical protein PVS2B2_07680 [Candidatus Acidiferrum sp.]